MFDLSRAPLFYAVFFSGFPSLVCFTAHHIITDPRSFEVLKADFLDFLSFSSEMKKDVVIEDHSYSDWLVRGEECRKEQELERKFFWKNAIGRATPVSLPGFEFLDVEIFRRKTITCLFPENVFLGVNEFFGRNKILTASFCATTFAFLVNRVYGIDPFVLTTTLTLRQDAREQNTVGYSAVIVMGFVCRYSHLRSNSSLLLLVCRIFCTVLQELLTLKKRNGTAFVLLNFPKRACRRC